MKLEDPNELKLQVSTSDLGNYNVVEIFEFWYPVPTEFH